MNAFFSNAIWFVLIWCVLILVGMLWEYNKRIVFVLTVSFFIVFVMIVIVVLLLKTYDDPNPWYYYIGSALAGLTWKISFDSGRILYRSVFPINSKDGAIE